LQDLAGNDAVTLASTSVTNTVVDTAAPTFVSAATSSDGTKVILTYSEDLSSTTAASSQFSVQVAGATRAISSVAVSGSTIQLTLSSPVVVNQAVTVTYSDTTAYNDTSAIQDLSGNDAPSLSSTIVLNNGQLSLPSVAKDMFVIKGDAAVSSWVVSVNIYNASNANVGTKSSRISQGTSGNNIEFTPNFNDIGNESFGLGFRWAFTVKGYAADGTTFVKDGQIGGPAGGASPTFYTSGNLYIAGLNSSGVVSNLPTTYSGNNLVALFSSDGSDVFSKGITTSALSQALSNNTLLQQYATNGNLGTSFLEGSQLPHFRKLCQATHCYSNMQLMEIWRLVF